MPSQPQSWNGLNQISGTFLYLKLENTLYLVYKTGIFSFQDSNQEIRWRYFSNNKLQDSKPEINYYLDYKTGMFSFQVLNQGIYNFFFLNSNFRI